MAAGLSEAEHARVCAHRPCSNLVDPQANPNAIYCSRRCKENARRSRQRREQPRVTVAPLTPRQCQHCQATIPEERGNRAIYCSLSCRHDASVKRRRNPPPNVADLTCQLETLQADIIIMAKLVLDMATNSDQPIPPEVRDWITTYLPEP